MISLRRMIAIVCGLFVAGWVYNVAQGTEASPAAGPTAEGVDFEAKANDGTIIKGRFLQTVLLIKADYGKMELDVKKVKQLDFSPGDDNTIAANVTLVDKNHLVGPLLTEEFRVTGADSPLKASNLKWVKLLHPKDFTLLAALIGLFTLTLMEIILGVDNIIFLAIIAGKLPKEQQKGARRLGLAAALGTRLLLLASLSLLLKLTEPLFTLPQMPLFNTMEARGISGRDLILFLGGIFLIGKSVKEMHDKIERAKEEEAGQPSKAANYWMVIGQIAVIDIIFSLDSVITAVGMVDEIWVMVTAMIIAVTVMILFAEPIAHFVEHRPTIKILALSFLILIGVLLVAEGLGQHMNKGYIYFAMAFAVAVEIINMRFRKK
jgi:predicted tellurium resistance membrane protein TerC